MIEAGDKVRNTATGQVGYVHTVENGWFTLVDDTTESLHDKWKWDLVAGLEIAYGDRIRIDDHGELKGGEYPVSGYSYSADGKTLETLRYRDALGREHVVPKTDACVTYRRDLMKRITDTFGVVLTAPSVLLTATSDPYETVAGAVHDDFFKDPEPSAINPPHYSQWKFQPIEFIQANDMPFWLGNVIKYACRAEQKNGVEDLQKAREYLQFKINELEGRKVTDNG